MICILSDPYSVCRVSRGVLGSTPDLMIKHERDLRLSLLEAILI
jgi:hypothetical protein